MKILDADVVVAAMPSKEQVRQWLHERRRHRRPLPSLEQIQCELGWRNVGDGPSMQDAGHRDTVAS